MQLAADVVLADDVLRIGSKRFTESYILGEILTQSVQATTRAEHRLGLGNTAIVFEALKTGAIDAYPEYTGTISHEILKRKDIDSLEDMSKALAPLGIGVGIPLGFSNGYALATRRDAQVSRVSGLEHAPGMTIGLSHEFIGRIDGWPGLAKRYGLQQKPIGLDHGLAYEALTARQVDVIDIYTTDAKLRQYPLRILDDDAGYFPRYDAVLLFRLDLAERFPRAWKALQGLEGKISQDRMVSMNAAAEIDGKSFKDIARSFLHAASARTDNTDATPGFADKLFDESFWRLMRDHITLVLLSVSMAALAGIPLGVLAAFQPRLRQAVMAIVGVLQTVPSLALLAMLIPLLGTIGTVPALVALFLYALLPVVRNTCTGIEQISPGLRMAALALGMRTWHRLLHIELPLALPVILAGLKTAAVMSVGTATIAAFIGAGGFGERIATGLAVNDNDMLLAGALPAAFLALVIQGLFELGEWTLRRRP
ncbi:glycine betaine ABC transporter substrate-binding protein [Noviherbaspirillum denitrificans]|uniref:Amino acid ABC transporter permease n=1 Tax=Noviherbaspirillum denitrificans TaxID=1968433 RepID=A0A254TD41_9BURK|nr:glycine betaine ABC transporter substrate-binding protein [Noviherbaspirillum denitrificans]OWW18463.1 amino acid ABC transporter permease [Noviherbaspirillum denitrificans]